MTDQELEAVFSRSYSHLDRQRLIRGLKRLIPLVQKSTERPILLVGQVEGPDPESAAFLKRYLDANSLRHLRAEFLRDAPRHLAMLERIQRSPKASKKGTPPPSHVSIDGGPPVKVLTSSSSGPGEPLRTITIPSSSSYTGGQDVVRDAQGWYIDEGHGKKRRVQVKEVRGGKAAAGGKDRKARIKLLEARGLGDAKATDAFKPIPWQLQNALDTIPILGDPAATEAAYRRGFAAGVAKRPRLVATKKKIAKILATEKRLQKTTGRKPDATRAELMALPDQQIADLLDRIEEIEGLADKQARREKKEKMATYRRGAQMKADLPTALEESAEARAMRERKEQESKLSNRAAWLKEQAKKIGPESAAEKKEREKRMREEKKERKAKEARMKREETARKKEDAKKKKAADKKTREEAKKANAAAAKAETARKKAEEKAQKAAQKAASRDATKAEKRRAREQAALARKEARKEAQLAKLATAETAKAARRASQEGSRLPERPGPSIPFTMDALLAAGDADAKELISMAGRTQKAALLRQIKGEIKVVQNEIRKLKAAQKQRLKVIRERARDAGRSIRKRMIQLRQEFLRQWGELKAEDKQRRDSYASDSRTVHDEIGPNVRAAAERAARLLGLKGKLKEAKGAASPKAMAAARRRADLRRESDDFVAFDLERDFPEAVRWWKEKGRTMSQFSPKKTPAKMSRAEHVAHFLRENPEALDIFNEKKTREFLKEQEKREAELSRKFKASSTARSQRAQRGISRGRDFANRRSISARREWYKEGAPF